MALAILTLLPWIVAWQDRPAGQQLWGVQPYNSVDTPVYFNYIEQVRSGELVLRDFYTTEEVPALFNPFWLLVGLFARLTGVSAFAAYQISRVALIPIFLLSLNALLIELNLNEKQRWRAILLVIASSGVGLLITGAARWFGQPIREILPDLQIPEYATFFIIHHSPHFIASVTLIILSFAAFLRATRTGRAAWALAGGLSALFLFLFHPYYVLLVYWVLAIYAALIAYRNKSLRSLKNAAIVAAVSLPAVIYYLYQLNVSHWLAEKAAQSITLSPPYWSLLIGLGFLLPLAAWGWRLIEDKESKGFLAVWSLVAVALVYSPFVFQRRFFEGLQIPLAVLASFAVSRIVSLGRQWSILPALSWALVFVVLGSSNVSVYLQHWRNPSYVSDDFIIAARWLRRNSPADAVVLADSSYQTQIPSLALRRVWVGHPHETLYVSSKLDLQRWFLSEPSPGSTKISALRQNGIDYVFLSRERGWPVDSALADKTNFQKVFDNDAVEIYKVL